jgi:hypothetical protein
MLNPITQTAAQRRNSLDDGMADGFAFAVDRAPRLSTLTQQPQPPYAWARLRAVKAGQVSPPWELPLDDYPFGYLPTFRRNQISPEILEAFDRPRPSRFQSLEASLKNSLHRRFPKFLR